MLRSKYLIYLLMISSLFSEKFVAILELEPIGLTGQEGRVLTQRLSSEFINLGVYSVMALDKVKELLREQGYKNYVDFHQYCIEKECAVGIGKIVTADYIVLGTVSKLGTTYNIDVKMIDVHNNDIVSTSIYNHVGEIDILLTEGIVSVAKEISPPPPPPPSPSKEINEAGQLEFPRFLKQTVNKYVVLRQ